MKKVLMIGLWAVMTLSFVFTFVNFDISVFWAYAKLVAHSDESGLKALVGVWEIKGLLFKAIVYNLYALTARFLSDFSLPCQYLYKFWGLLLIEVITGLTAAALPKAYCKGLSKPSVFFLLSICSSTIHPTSPISIRYPYSVSPKTAQRHRSTSSNRQSRKFSTTKATTSCSTSAGSSH